MATDGAFHYEVENSTDELGNKVTTVKCHGRLISETTPQISNLVKPLIPQGGRIVLDLTDLNYLDSSGLGTLVGLQVSAIKAGYCRLEFVNMTPNVLKLMRMTNLANLFTSSTSAQAGT
jgi:anti-anti-sigma factor